MRWPFAWTIRGPRRGSGVPGETGATAPDAASSVAAHRPTGAWAEVPPLAPVIAPTPLTAPAREFVGELAGSRPPDPILRPLEHETAGDGPVGIVAGRARPTVASEHRTRAMPDLPRPARAGLDQRPRNVDAGRATDGGPADDARVTGIEDAGVRAASAGPVALAGAEEPRHLAPVPGAARETGRRLTAVEPGSVISLADRAPTVAHADAGGRASSTDGPRDRAAPSTARSPRTAPRPSAGPDADQGRPGFASDRPAARRPDPEARPNRPGQARIIRRTIAGGPQSRRTRLGAPIDGPLPHPTPRGNAVGPEAGGQVDVPERVAPPAPALGGGALPLPVLRRTGAAGRPDATGRRGVGDASGSPHTPSGGPARPTGSRDPGAVDGPATPARAARRAGATRTPGRRTAPILARRPLRAAGPRSAAPRPRLVPPPDDVDPRRRDARPAEPGQGTRTAIGPIGGSPPDEVSGEPERWVGPLAGPSAGSIPAHPTPAAAADLPMGLTDRRAGSVPPAWHPRPGRMLDAPVGPVVAGPDHEGLRSVTRSPTAVRVSPPDDAQGAAGLPRAAETDQSSGEEGTSGSEPATEVPGSAPAGEERGDAGSSGGAGIAATSEADLDVLARRLYGRLRERLAGELLLDRERAGLLADR